MRLRNRAVARCEQLLVEVEKGDDRGPAAPNFRPVEHRLGADEDVGILDVFRVGIDIEHAEAREQRGQLLAHAGNARAQHAQPRAAALVAEQGAVGGAIPAQQ